MIVCCGEALIDLLPREGKDGVLVFQPFNGGSIYNTAIALGRLGARVSLFTTISNDFFGDQIMVGLAESGVKVSYIQKRDQHTTVAFVKFEGGHARYSFIDDNSASQNLSIADLPELKSTVQHLHFGSISLIPEQSGGAYEALCMREADARTISIDPNIRAGVIKDKVRHFARLERMMAKSDIVKMSDEDANFMMQSQNFRTIALKLIKEGSKIVIFTRGGEGVDIYTKAHRVELPAPKVKVVDTVGAGDTFTAGFLANLSDNDMLRKESLASIKEEELRDAALYAMRAAAVTVSREGCDPPWLKDMQTAG